MSDREAWGRSGTLTGATAGGFSTGLGCSSRSTQGAQKSTEGTLDATRRETLGWSRPLPRQALLGHQGSGQPELPEDRRQQPGPAIGRGGVAEPHCRPAQLLFGKAERMLHDKAAQVPSPDLV